MKYKKKIIIIIISIILILAIFVSIFISYKNKLKEKEIFNQGYAIYINGGNGTYSPASAFPIGSYELNVARTTCASGASLNDVSYNSALGVITFKINRPDRCNYYFDKVQPIYNDQYVDYATKALEPGAIMNFTYQGSVKSITLPAGTYQLEVWGAGVNVNNGANGGYSKGTITFSGSQILYLAVGQAGNTTNYNAQTFNGGGAGGKNPDATVPSGGGATHIATADGVLKNLESNKGAIIIVAGGGAGATRSGFSGGIGHGGGTTGASGGYSDNCDGHTLSGAGTQTSGGAKSHCQCDEGEDGFAGSFGQGGDGSKDSGGYQSGGYGGGGGYYGGGGGCYDWWGAWSSEVMASGGSGYISSVLTNASTTQETTSTSPGADKNGYIRITML